jgi:4-amino-4-deoxy-L-arabinose transferase-like glycosyltransferase
VVSQLIEPDTMSIAIPRAEAGSTSRTRFFLSPILTLAVALRLVVDWFMVTSHTPDWFWFQGTELAVLGDNLRSGLGLSSPFGGATGPSAFLAPGYPAIVAADFALFHPYSHAAFAALVVMQTLFSVAAIVLFMLITRRLFGNAAANIAGIVWAISPPLLWIDVFFWETSFSILFVCALLALTLRCADDPTVKLWLALGATSALALLVNPSLLTLIGCCILWTLWQTRSVSKASPIAGALLFLAIFAPWPIRNLHAMHTFIPLRSNMGYELWQGNRDGADGYFKADLHPNVSRDQFRQYSTLGEVAYMRRKSGLAHTAIAGDPTRFATLTAKRIVSFWIGKGRTYSGLVVAQITASTILGFVGLALLYRRRRDLFMLFLPILILFPAPYYLTHPDFRFRLVIDPIVTGLAAYAITSWKKSPEVAT